MIDRPIIFSAAMVRALLDGRKTQTRRLAWRQMTERELAARPNMPHDCEPTLPTPWQRARPGDRLWVREAFCLTAGTSHPYVRFEQHNPAKPTEAVMHRAGCWGEWPQSIGTKWRPSIHMPRWASRLTLVVTEVRRQRLQETSEQDAIAEGVYRHRSWGGAEWFCVDGLRVPGYASNRARDVFAFLWDSLHGKGAWAANPEVIALSFEIHRQNIDAMERAAA